MRNEFERGYDARKHEEEDNGYSNHETFTVHMDIHSNNGIEYLNYWRACAQEAKIKYAKNNMISGFADDIAAHYERKQANCVQFNKLDKRMPGTVEVMRDLLTAAIERVDWIALSKELLEEVAG